MPQEQTEEGPGDNEWGRCKGKKQETDQSKRKPEDRPVDQREEEEASAKPKTVINEPTKSIKQANMKPFSTVPNSEAAPSSCP